MQWRNSPDRYGAVIQGSHWLTVLLIVLAWLLGEFHDAIPRGTARSSAIWIHKEAGLLVIVLVAFRVAWHWIDPPPAPEPTRFGALAQRTSQAAHWLMYLLMLAIPVTGVLMSFARGRPLDLFGLYQIASPWADDRAFAAPFKEAHELLSNALLIIAFAHAAAALAHHWMLRDSTLRRMLPGRAR
jgi:cytochrome b561